MAWFYSIYNVWPSIDKLNAVNGSRLQHLCVGGCACVFLYVTLCNLVNQENTAGGLKSVVFLIPCFKSYVVSRKLFVAFVVC